MIKLETERLCLRDYVEADFEAYYKLKTDDRTMYYIDELVDLVVSHFGLR